MSLPRLPTDVKILAAVAKWGNGSATYVVKNVLRMDGYDCETPWVLRQLKRLEAAGLTRRVPSSYTVMITWGLTPEGWKRSCDVEHRRGQ